VRFPVSLLLGSDSLFVPPSLILFLLEYLHHCVPYHLLPVLVPKLILSPHDPIRFTSLIPFHGPVIIFTLMSTYLPPAQQDISSGLHYVPRRGLRRRRGALWELRRERDGYALNVERLVFVHPISKLNVYIMDVLPLSLSYTFVRFGVTKSETESTSYLWSGGSFSLLFRNVRIGYGIHELTA
jgi:hypothetical protein